MKVQKVYLYIFVIIVGGLSLFLLQRTPSKSPLISPLGQVEALSGNDVSLPRFQSLEEAVTSSLKGVAGDYSFSIKNLKTGESYNLNEHKSYQTASLYKLWVMAVVFDQIQKGNLNESQVLSQSAAILNSKFNIDSGDAEIKEGQITLTVKDALELMITISHNYAALLLSEKVRLSQVSFFLERNGFNESKIGTDGSIPESTAADMALFLEKLYTGKLANTENTTKMIELLKRQRLNNKIPKNLPEGVVVAHKTGEIGGFSHDVGIIFTPKGDYVLVVLTDSPKPAIAEDRIGIISRLVYAFFK